MRELSLRGRRTLEAVLVSGLALGLAALGTAPATAATPQIDPPAVVAKADTGSELSGHDQQLLNTAVATKEKTVTVMLLAEEGQTGSLESQITSLGGSISTSVPAVGYIRALVPTTTVERIAKLPAVAGIDLNETLTLPKPEAATTGTAKVVATVDPPGKNTPAANPYLPTNETGSVAFKKKHPKWDGRGITIGVVDSGISLDNPALQKTSTGARKIVDWVTGTHPAADGDKTWLPMQKAVSGPTFNAAEATWTAPSGNYLFNQFSELITDADQLEGDVNRDGDKSDTFGVLYNATTHDIRVDSNQNHNFTDDTVMRPYREKFQVGHFGVDKSSTPERDQVPFVVEYREDVDLAPLGQTGKADFVNIGITEDEHGSHVAGIAAGNDMLGNANYDGQAPGAKLVSSRACSWGGGCTAAALSDGLVDLVVNRGVDVVNISIGGLPALNDGDNDRADLYNRLIANYGVQLFISAGNDGPGVNTVGDPGVVSDVVSVAAAVSKETWLANYGSVVSKKLAMFPFSSRGPREDGGFKPNITAPGSAIATTDSWLPGSAVAETGYSLPPGYAHLQGTSMSSPQATGAAALLLSAAKASKQTVTPAQLRRSIYSSAKFQKGIASYAQGNGFFDVPGAWTQLSKKPKVRNYTVSAPVCTAISGSLRSPNKGTGIFNNCAAGAGGHKAGQRKSYIVTIKRTSGAAGSITHKIKLVGNDGTFSAPASVKLPLNKAVKVTVKATPKKAGAHSAIIRFDDPKTRFVDFETQNMVVVATEVKAPKYTYSASGTVERNSTTSYFINVPKGTPTLQVSLSGIAKDSQTRWIAINPYGLHVEQSSTLVCYPNYSDPALCNPLDRSYSDPIPGIWELEVESRRTSPLLKNPFTLTAQLQGVTVSPSTVTLPSVTIGVPTAVTWTGKNTYGPVKVHAEGGTLGSSVTRRPSIAQGAQVAFTVAVPAGVDRVDAAITNPADVSADLDLYLVDPAGDVAAQSADGDSDESLSFANPAAGTYTVVVDGYSVPDGTTAFDYLDVFYSPLLGNLQVPGTVTNLANGATLPVTGSVVASSAVADGRKLFGEVKIVTDKDALVGSATVQISQVSSGPKNR